MSTSEPVAPLPSSISTTGSDPPAPAVSTPAGPELVGGGARLFAGVDVGAGRADAALIAVNGAGRAFVSAFCGPVGELAGYCQDAVRVAVDAPGGLSAGAHLGDASVAPKFRSGRCSEIPVRGVPAVPWVTPPSLDQAPGWMRTGFEVWATLSSAGLETVETFPAALFHRLNGRRWPPAKTTVAGRAARLELLSRAVSFPAGVASGWTHDRLDAVACALVAAVGRPAGHDCDRPDGSVMWLAG